MQHDLVTIVIPAYNAEKTLHETLLTARAQSYGNLEILVIDDGSQDNTARIAESHAAQDMRIRLIRQDNAGVAAARNRGIKEAKGEYIATLDADDLWHPEKIALQRAAFFRSGRPIGLVYTWSAYIDEDNTILSTRRKPLHEGDVLTALCLSNFVNNGSAPMMLKKALLEIGGFDSGLRAAHAQGCEDYQTYFRIAEHYNFAVVPQHLTGYRQYSNSMSGDVLQMLRSYDMFMKEFRERHLIYHADMDKGRVNLLIWLLWRALRAKKWAEAFTIMSQTFKTEPLFAAFRFLSFSWTAMNWAMQKANGNRNNKKFIDCAALEHTLNMKRAA